MSRSLTYRELLRVALVSIVLLFGLFLMWRFMAGVATAILMLLAGLLLAVALSGPVEFMHRRKVPRSVATGSIIVGALALLGLVGYLFFPEFEEQAFEFSFALPSAFNQLGEQVEEFASRFGISLAGGSGLSSSTLVGWGRRLLGGALGLFTDAVSVLLGAVIAVFTSIYLVVNPRPVVGWVVRIFPPESRHQVWGVLCEARVDLLDWLKGRLASMAIVGVLSTTALYLIGIPGALLLGLFTGLVSFVPYIGPLISVVPPVVLAFASGGQPIDALWVVLAYVAIQQVESYMLTPLIMQKTASLHPAVVIASVTVLGAAFGILGAVLALPITVVVGVLIKELWFQQIEKQTEKQMEGD